MKDLTAAIQASPIADRKADLYDIYRRFEKDSSEYTQNAVCCKGCSFCCTFMGDVDITTLEGLIILERMNAFSQGEKALLSSRIETNMSDKEKGKKSPCPFLNEHGYCAIYDIRPFSCRQLYSLRKCQGEGATIHRQAYQLSRAAIASIQQLDHTGYSGHLSFILHLIEDAGFRKVYLAGGFAPEKIQEFGKGHGIVINRRVQATGRARLIGSRRGL